MKHIMKLIALFLAASLMASPVIAKSDSDSKATSSKSKKDKKSKSSKKSKKESKSKKSDKKSTSKTKSKSKKDKDSTKSSDTKDKTKSSKSSDKSSSSSSDDSKSSSKRKKTTSRSKSTRTSLANSNKAKQFKNITVNINKADAETLQYYLVGIGEKRANDIVKYRSKNGKFKSLDDLTNVTGLGDGIFGGIKKNISLSSGETSAPKKTASSSKSSK